MDWKNSGSLPQTVEKTLYDKRKYNKFCLLYSEINLFW